MRAWAAPRCGGGRGPGHPLWWPRDRGIWWILGSGWLCGWAYAGWPRSALGLAAAAACGVMARERLLWAAWTTRRRLPAPSGWGWGIPWALVGAAAAVWWWMGSPGGKGGLLLVALAALAEGALRVWDARPCWPQVLAGGVGALGMCLAAGGGWGAEPGRASLGLLAACVGYAAAAAGAAVGLAVERVARARLPVRRLGWAFLLGVTGGGGGLLLLWGAVRGQWLLPVVAVALAGANALAAGRPWRARDFRRLGWQQAAFLMFTALVLLGLGGAGR